jgi:hypothetical protein
MGVVATPLVSQIPSACFSRPMCSAPSETESWLVSQRKAPFQ